MLALGRGAAAAISDGLSGDDAILLAMLGLISVMVVSQAFSLLRTLPGTRVIWRWTARVRQRSTAPTPERPLFAQADARALVDCLPASTPHDGGGRLHLAARTAAWVALTLVIMAAAIAGAGLVAVSAIRSVEARGWGFRTLFGFGVAALIGYGVTTMSIGLVRSWFERRRRRLRRMLMRLLRYLLRGFDRSTTALRRTPVRLDSAIGLLGRSVLATGGAAVVVAASLAIPVSAVDGTAAKADSPGSTSTSIVGGDHGTPAGIATVGSRPEEGGAEAGLFDSAPGVTAATATTAAARATPIAAGTTAATTATATTATTAAPFDTTSPVLGGISDGPDPIYTTGNTPDTSQITVTTSDESGVASVTVYYRLGGGSFAVWASPKPGTTSTTFGPFTKTGTYEYRIMATDTLGNSNCKTPATCPGGTVTVLTP